MNSEYTVKVLSKRPKPQPIDQSLVDFRNQHFARAEIPRRDGKFYLKHIMTVLWSLTYLYTLAVLNASQGRKGGATTFARSGKVNKNKK